MPVCDAMLCSCLCSCRIVRVVQRFGSRHGPSSRCTRVIILRGGSSAAAAAGSATAPAATFGILRGVPHDVASASESGAHARASASLTLTPDHHSTADR